VSFTTLASVTHQAADPTKTPSTIVPASLATGTRLLSTAAKIARNEKIVAGLSSVRKSVLVNAEGAQRTRPDRVSDVERERIALMPIQHNTTAPMRCSGRDREVSTIVTAVKPKAATPP
jgi:hypothetical protein